MTKQRLIKRLEWYYPLEKLHAYATFPLIFIAVLVTNDLGSVLFLLYGLLVCIYILYQGQWYWKLKLMKLKNESFEQKMNIDFFKTSKRNNLILLGLMPIVLIAQYYYFNWTFIADNMMLWAVLSNLFAIAEYVNYYHIQLSIDNKYDWDYLVKHKGFKTSKLANDLMNNEI